MLPQSATFRYSLFRALPLLRHFFSSDMSQLEVFRWGIPGVHGLTAAMPACRATAAGNPRWRCPEMPRKTHQTRLPKPLFGTYPSKRALSPASDPTETPEIWVFPLRAFWKNALAGVLARWIFGAHGSAFPGPLDSDNGRVPGAVLGSITRPTEPNGFAMPAPQSGPRSTGSRERPYR
jgi:hypothetical protein